MEQFFERTFKLREHGTTVKTEAMAGTITFLSMVYILAVNPSILSASGMEPGAVFTATAISAAFGTLFMAFYANYPIALASGMGLNAYFAYSVCVPMAEQGIQDPWIIALTAVLVEGVIFILLTLCKFREALVNDVPENLKMGIAAGIGLFIALVGLANAGVVVDNPSTLIDLGSFATPQVALSVIGLVAVAVMYSYRVPGYILWGILGTWLLGIVAQLIGWYEVDPAAGAYSLIPSFAEGINLQAPYLFAFDFDFALSHIVDFAVIVFAFLFVDLFDTAGTLIGVASKGGLLDKEGRLPRAKEALMADAVGTVVGACVGTSTTTSYVESSAGVAAGGRTGLTALVTGLLFIAALVLSPIFLAIPSFATMPALVWVGLLMMSSVTKMDFSEDAAGAVGGFLAIIMMPFTYSIANGIMFGILAFVVVRICQGRAKDVHWVMWIAAALFLLRIATLVI
ncbi:NCS2 family permease [Adlercreutzia muris]|uniref:NCS2 family permease n=1 Tax=Adlercreutzia muris TaxID=1796610 RepID=UPI001F5840A0|nr:NCS2 family permease [Adlercreutzia muris]